MAIKQKTITLKYWKLPLGLFEIKAVNNWVEHGLLPGDSIDYDRARELVADPTWEVLTVSVDITNVIPLPLPEV